MREDYLMIIDLFLTMFIPVIALIIDRLPNRLTISLIVFTPILTYLTLRALGIIHGYVEVKP